VLAGMIVLRMEWAQMDDWYNMRYRTHTVAWFFVLGWLIQRSETWRQRVLTTLVCLAVIPGFFQDVARDWRITVMLIALVWVRQVPVPRWLVPPIGVLAAASMWIYVSHFSIWPPLRTVFDREVAYVLTIAAGVAIWFAAERLFGRPLHWWRNRLRGPIRPTTTVPRLYLTKGLA